MNNNSHPWTRSLTNDNCGAALLNVVKSHVHASGGAIREVSGPVLNALRKIMQHKTGKHPSANFNNGENHRARYGSGGAFATNHRPSASALIQLGNQAPRSTPLAMSAAVKLFTLLARDVRALCPVGRGGNAALKNQFTNESLMGAAETNTKLFIAMRYDGAARYSKPVGVCAMQDGYNDGVTSANTTNPALKNLRRLGSTGHAAEITLACGSGGTGELAFLAALAKVASARKARQRRYKAVAVELAFKGTAPRGDAWKTAPKDQVPMAAVAAKYGFERVPMPGKILVMVQDVPGTPWPVAILRKLASERYANDPYGAMCPAVPGTGFAYCW